MFKNIGICLLVILPFLGGCAATERGDITIWVGEMATDLATARDLKADFARIGRQDVEIRNWSGALPSGGQAILLGTVGHHAGLDQLIKDGLLDVSVASPGPRGGVWEKVEFQGETLVVLAGSDKQGTQYAVYDYSREILGVDPLFYWTGIEPQPRPEIDIRNFEPRRIPPPQVPYLVYFENDVDELANLKKPYLEYDWESYTQLIDALVRLRYNGIEFFDMLGREEFYTREGYKKIRPDYQFNIPLLERMIDYAHEKGMLVQIDMMMGRPYKSITMEESNCWSKYQQRWIDTWTYYLTETPINKADIFTLRPRNQVLDWPYKSDCGEDRVEVFNQVYATLDEVLNQYKPDAVKVCVCYDDGMEIYNQGFNPPEDFIIAWSDDGWGGFRVLPEDTRGFRFGTYMHAGFWLNHDVHDPYPEKIERVMKDMFSRFGADQYLMVNGQTFRLFLINLEAFSRVAASPESFNGGDFYDEWIARYFGSDAIADTRTALTQLHAAQFDNVGYVEHLWEIKSAVAYLTDQPIQRPGRTPIPIAFEDIEPVIEPVRKRMALLSKAEAAATAGLSKTDDKFHFYHDHIYLPIKLYRDLLNYERDLHELALLKRANEINPDPGLREQATALIKSAEANLQQLYDRRRAGDKNPRWTGWYQPEKRRPNNGFPNEAELNAVAAHIDAGWQQ